MNNSAQNELPKSFSWDCGQMRSSRALISALDGNHAFPNTGNAAPFTAREASEARNAITSAIADGSTHLLKSPFGIAARFCGVSIVPGIMQFTLMLEVFN